MEIPVDLVKEGTMFAVVVMQFYVLNTTMKELKEAINGLKKEMHLRKS